MLKTNMVHTMYDNFCFKEIKTILIILISDIIIINNKDNLI